VSTFFKSSGMCAGCRKRRYENALAPVMVVNCPKHSAEKKKGQVKWKQQPGAQAGI